MAGHRLSPGVNRSKAKPYSRPVLIRALYKSSLEDRIAAQLEQAGVAFDYEKLKLEYEVPARVSRYTPDFVLPNGIIIESKGWLKPEDRKILSLVKASHPELDIRLLFNCKDARRKFIYKGSPTSYAKWCEDHGFPWADGGKVPHAWIEEKRQ